MQVAEKAAKLTAWLRGQVVAAGAQGLVVGVSGGIDSAVVVGLAARAVPGKVLGVIMPCHSLAADAADAAAVLANFGVAAQQVDLGPVHAQFLAALAPKANAAATELGEPDQSTQPEGLAQANLKPRLRMATLYYFANRLNYLVAGTGNRSELEVGYFTKYGDGGVDLLPLGGLVKTEVRELAEYLGVPAAIIARPPSAGLWEGQTDEGELGLTYAVLDKYLLTGEAPDEAVERIVSRQAAARHKLVPAPIPEL